MSDDFKKLIMVTELCVCSLAEIMFLDQFVQDEQYVLSTFLQCIKGLNYIHDK